MERFLWICLAGAAGTGSRYLIALWAAQRLGSAFPYGTLIVNLAGCFAIAAVMHAALTLGWSPNLRAAITIGFLGGLTTYSSFNYETTKLIEEGALATAALNAGVTIFGAFAAGLFGMLFARQLLGR
ncbi:MAG TPA: CrcB family protein [Vicinamibacterales bacterium]|nr:CrcB family protein [Vicinamibacterales bacterium]